MDKAVEHKGQRGGGSGEITAPLCERCGVPLQVSAELKWESNGVISSRTSKRVRWVFYESDNLDPLFHNIDTLIGMPIENIIIASRCRETRKYMRRAFPAEYLERIQRMLKGEVAPEERRALLDMSKMAARISYDLACIYGYGKVTFGPLWEEDDDRPWRISITGDPYCLSFQAGESLGTCEAFEDRDMWVKHPLTPDNRYQMIYYEADHPVELAGTTRKKLYELKPGGIEYERCPACDTPLEVAAHTWDLDRGIITDPETGRRKAIFGSYALDAIFQDLQDELGEAIPETIIEAQRLYAKTVWNVEKWNRGAEDFNRLLAARGLGQVADFEGDRKHLSVRIENSCLDLLLVGLIQAMVEMAYHAESSTCNWQSLDDGDLVVTVNLA